MQKFMTKSGKYVKLTERKEILDKYKQGHTCSELCIEHKITRDIFYTIMKDFSYKKGTKYKRTDNQILYRKRKYKVDFGFFEIINTEEKAYILGFLYADGYNNEKKGQIRINLQERDKEILEKIKDCISKESPIQLFYRNAPNQNVVTWQLQNRKISSDLAKWGCIQNKTKSLSYPLFLSEELEKHFIRGYFDGDGSIYARKSHKAYSFRLTGYVDFIKTVQERLIHLISLNPTKLSKRTMQDTTVHLIYSGRLNVQKIRNFLYEDATIYLQRKHTKFFEI